MILHINPTKLTTILNETISGRFLEQLAGFSTILYFKETEYKSRYIDTTFGLFISVLISMASGKNWYCTFSCSFK